MMKKKKRVKGKRFSGKVTFYGKKCCICGSSGNLEHLTLTRDIRIEQDVKSVICRNCGLVFLNPAPTDETYSAFYKSQRKPRKSKEEFVYKKQFLYKAFTQILDDNLPNLGDLNVLDVRSGNGAFLHYLKPFVRNLRSLEVSENAQIDIPKFFGINVLSADKLSDVIDPGSLDLITSLAVIEHYNDPAEGLQDYYQALKPGGKVFIYTPDLKGLALASGENAYFKFIHPYYFTINTLSALLERVGFGNIFSWQFGANYKHRSVFTPTAVTSGFMVIIAEKTDVESAPSVYRDSPDEIRRCLNEARAIEKAFLPQRLLHRFIFRYLKKKGKNLAMEGFQDTYQHYMGNRSAVNGIND